MDPLIVRLLVPLGVTTALYFVVDFLVTSRWLARHAGSLAETGGRKRVRVMGLVGLLLITALGIVGAVTFHYRRDVSLQKVRAQELSSPGASAAREALREQVRLECLAVFGPIVIGSVIGLALRSLERRRRRARQGEAGRGSR
jgi:hypothetical protein